MPSIISPLDSYRTSSPPGMRIHPVMGERKFHAGMDMAAPIGTPIKAPTDLRVVSAGAAGTAGNMITAKDGEGNTHRFMHLNSIGVSPGETIAQGDIIGTVGSTGRSTGPHLHYEIKDKLGNVLDPKKLLAKGEEIGKKAIVKAIDKGKDALKKGAIAAGLANPVTGPAVAAAVVADELLGDDGCGINPICHLKKWLKESEFFPRLGLAIVAVILLIGAVLLLARAQTGRMISTTVKGSLK